MFYVEPVGHVESPLRRREDAPKQGEEGAPLAILVFDPKYREAASSIAVGDRVIVLTWLDRGDREVLKVHPRGDPSVPLRGVFSTRSPDRPNPIGLHRVVVNRIHSPLRFEIHGMEALHMTPILDVKTVLEGISET